MRYLRVTLDITVPGDQNLDALEVLITDRVQGGSHTYPTIIVDDIDIRDES